MRCGEVLNILKKLGDPRNVEGMARFGIKPAVALGVPKPALRKLAKDLGQDHHLAQRLWASGMHESRVLASMVDDPVKVTGAQMEAWANDFDNWDICDQCCMNLFRYTNHACWAEPPPTIHMWRYPQLPDDELPQIRYHLFRMFKARNWLD